MEIKKLNWKILIPKNSKQTFNIAGKEGLSYIREPTKREIVEKINEIIDFLHGYPANNQR